jgi:2'-5' RNA ligase
VRLFFAVELPDNVQAALGRLLPAEDPADRAAPDYRWVDASLLHVTLAFLGEQPEDRLAALEHVGRQSAQASAPGTLTLGTAGSFGSRRTPRVLWVDVAGDLEALAAMQSRLALALRTGGFPLEDRPFRPHITLARRREAARGGAPPGWPPDVRRMAFPMRQLTLMRSQLSSHGPSHTPLFHFAVGSG